MFCKNCGKKIDDDANFCPQCGTPQNSVSDDSEKKWNTIEDEPLCCPMCGSRQVTVYKKGYDLTTGVLGGLVAGNIGLLAGFLGHNDLRGACLTCGYKWDL
jgi:RNA polymerase subunit RPABC4/transcription elongation factor Spt4